MERILLFVEWCTDESAAAPTSAGKYTAKITVEEKTASVDYEILHKQENGSGDVETKGVGAHLNLQVEDARDLLTKEEQAKVEGGQSYVVTLEAKALSEGEVPAADKIRVGKKTYRVTSIAPYAFTGFVNLRTVKIGKNVKKIGAHAFYGAKRLKTVKVASGKLTAKGVKGSLKGSKIKKVAVQKSAAGKLSMYRKIFKKERKGVSVVKE